MKFTQDWFSHNIPNFQAVKKELGSVERILEIGCFEGRATCWMLENMLNPNGWLYAIDTFEGSEEHTNLELNNLFDTFQSNIDEARKETQGVSVYSKTSYHALSFLIAEGYRDYFDFIYVDGSHKAPDVMTDACMSFNLLKPNGIMLFDDYMWLGMPGILNQPKIAIDAFTTLFSDRCVVRMVGYQLAIQKDGKQGENNK